jgi:hypothetical protein
LPPPPQKIAKNQASPPPRFSFVCINVFIKKFLLQTALEK